MATLFPSYEDILKFKIKPTKGEIILLNFLRDNLHQSFEVYFNPYMNGDRPDIIIMRKGYGLLIIEVKDWNLDSYELDDRKNWKVKNGDFTIKSPIQQVQKYKTNLFELHIDKLLEIKIKDFRNFNFVNTAVYFHNAQKTEIEAFLVKPFEHDRKYMDFLKYNVKFIGIDDLNKPDFYEILHDLNSTSWKSKLFTDDIYTSIRRFIKPSIHLLDQGKDIPYSKKQREIIYSDKKEQRIKGVVGSGKTTVLAARAVQAHKRTGGKVLILTYNITLKNFLLDRINDVREKFDWNNFIIMNYHLFINAELNNLGIPFEIDSNLLKGKSEEETTKYFEEKYYSNKELFIKMKHEIKQYDVILIDEIQDYKRPWMEIIKECFLANGGEYVLFGDVKQNVYNNQTEGKDVSTNVKGVIELKRCFRSDFKIKDLAINYQKEIFKNKYEIDTFNEPFKPLELGLETDKLGSINYIFLPNAYENYSDNSSSSIRSLYEIIHKNAINKNIPQNDITVLGHTIDLLKDFDAYYRYSSNERTNTMFESNELVYRMGFNFIKTTGEQKGWQNNVPDWIRVASRLMKTDKFKKPNDTYKQLSILLSIQDLRETHNSKFDEKLKWQAEKYKTTYDGFINFYNTYKEKINEFRNLFSPKKQSGNIEKVRKNKKLHFRMNSGTIKISTVHSFKGWESDTLFLIMEDKYDNEKSRKTFDEILYTGLTRCKSNLVLINFGNSDYHHKMDSIVKHVK